MTTYKNYNKEYFETLKTIWSGHLQLFKQTKNPVRELTRIASVVRVYSRQLLKVQELKARRDYEMSQPTKNLVELNRIALEADRLGEEKCYAMLWETVAADYDAMVEIYYETNEQHYNFKTSDQILEDAKAYKKEVAISSLEEIDI